MAVTVERLIATLEARFDKYDRALNKALGNTDRTFTRIERRGKQMERRMAAMGAGIGMSFTKALAVAGGIRGFQSLLDSATRIENALKVAGLEGDNLTKVYDRLFQSAQKNAAPLENLVELYGRVALVQKDLNVSQEEMLNFTDKIALALRVSGQSAAESSGALLQLSQALGSGKVQAQEFQSILEGALPIAQAAAAGLKEAGGSVARLRQLVVDGKVSSEAFFRAFEAGAPMLEEKVAGATLTTSQGLQLIRNEMVKAAGDFAKGSLAADSLGEAFAMMADKINSVNFEEFGKEVRALIDLLGQLQTAIGWVRNLGANFGSATGLDRFGEVITGGKVQRELGPVTITSTRALQRRIDEAFGQTVESAGNLTVDALKNWADRNGLSSPAAGGKTGRLPASGALSPVSLDDFGAPAGKGKGGGRGGKRQNELEREIQQIKERTAAIQAETAAMMGINPLIDDYGYALEKARTKQDLLTAAKRAGIAVTPELEANIEKLAEGYAQASVEAEKLAESQERARQTAEEMRDLGKDVMGGFIKDLINGKSAADALASAIGKIGDKLLDIALDSLFSGGFGGKGGLLGGLLIPGILHKGGVAGRDGYGHGRAVSPAVFAGAPRYHKGGVAGLRPDEVPAILQKGELIIPRGGSAGTSVAVTYSPVIDARGADAGAVARIERILQQDRVTFESRVISAVADARRRHINV